MATKIIYNEQGICLQEAGGALKTILGVSYDENNDRVTLTHKSIAGASMMTVVEGETGNLVQIPTNQLSAPHGPSHTPGEPDAIPGLSAVPVYDRLLWVDGLYTGNDGNGSIAKPFATIQDALDAIPAPASAAEELTRYTILVAPGCYDEDLSIPPSRRIAILGLGPITLGDGAGQYFASTTPRNITWHLNQTLEFSQARPTLILGTLVEAETSTTHPGYAGGFDISGNLVTIDDGGVWTTHELHLYGVKIRGTVDLDANSCLVYARRGHIVGALTGAEATLSVVESTQFDALITVKNICRLVLCEIKGGMTYTAVQNYLPPNGLYGCDLSGVYTSAVNLPMDGVTNYWFKTRGASFAGGAGKAIFDDLTP